MVCFCSVLVTIWALSVFMSMWLIPLKSIEQPEGQGLTECAKWISVLQEVGLVLSCFWPHFSLGQPLEAFQRLVTSALFPSALFPGDAMDMCMFGSMSCIVTVSR